MALGRIGGQQAIEALQGAWPHSLSGALHDAEFDGLLVICKQVAGQKVDRASALIIFQGLNRYSKTEAEGHALFRGVILASGSARNFAYGPGHCRQRCR